MHETNAEPAGSRPRCWLPAWTKRPDTPSLAFTRPTPAKWILSASRLIGVLWFVAVAGMFVIAAVGFGLARHNDERLSLSQHVALRSAIVEICRRSTVRRQLIRDCCGWQSRSPVLKKLKFERNPARHRETQPVMDSTGRVTGFFTWTKTVR